MQYQTSTASRIARAIERGIRANFAPETQDTELRRLAELFTDMAMSRRAESELSKMAGEAKKAWEDSLLLYAIGDELDR
jgi:hypothetical protein